jgi:hypothetical protein
MSRKSASEVSEAHLMNMATLYTDSADSMISVPWKIETEQA